MRLLRLLHEVLREIFDEAAYERFCAREGLPVGPDSYGRFVTRTDIHIKPRCC